MIFLQTERLRESYDVFASMCHLTHWIARNPSGKILKRDLRELAKEEWLKRNGRALDSKAKL